MMTNKEFETACKKYEAQANALKKLGRILREEIHNKWRLCFENHPQRYDFRFPCDDLKDEFDDKFCEVVRNLDSFITSARETHRRV